VINLSICHHSNQ